MTLSSRFQLLACLMLYVGSAQAIMVKFGTKMGPIEPPTPEPVLPARQPYRAPAPVWERIDDTPAPNAQWRPQLFKPQSMYTHVVNDATAPSEAQPSNAQLFVKAYLPKRQPIPAEPITHYFSPAYFLGTKSLPGIGIRYFIPAYINSLLERKNVHKQEDSKINDIETNEINNNNDNDASDLKWNQEKEVARKDLQAEGSQRKYVYQWPEFVPRRLA